MGIKVEQIVAKGKGRDLSLLAWLQNPVARGMDYRRNGSRTKRFKIAIFLFKSIK
jgi:hypothetical protein